MLLAAGKGVRMGELSEHTPKPLIKTNKGMCLIEHHLYALAKAGYEDIVINVSHHAEQIKQALGNGSKYNVNIQYSEESEPMETGGGVFQALPLLGDEPFVIISSDVWTDYPIEKLPKKLEELAYIVLVDNPDHHPLGDFCLLDGNIIESAACKLTYSGIGVISPKLFQGCKPVKFSLASLLVKAMQDHQVSGEHYHGTLINVNTPEFLDLLHETCKDTPSE